MPQQAGISPPKHLVGQTGEALFERGIYISCALFCGFDLKVECVMLLRRMHALLVCSIKWVSVHYVV